MGLEVWAPESPVHESPFEPVILQLCTLERFQYTLVVAFLGTSDGWTCRWPVSEPLLLNKGDGLTQVAAPGEQKKGEVHVVMVEVLHELLVY